MATLSKVALVLRRVRRRLRLTQWALARQLNASVGTVQHWEHGRNGPGLARLLALRQLCPPSPERTQLDALVQLTQVGVASLEVERPAKGAQKLQKTHSPTGASVVLPIGKVELLRQQHNRLRGQVEKLEGILKKRDEQMRVLQDRTVDLQREVISLRVRQKSSANPTNDAS